MSVVFQITPFGGVVIRGSQPPTDSVGVVGNLYVHVANGIYDIYGPKTTAGWGSPTSLLGPPNSLTIGTVTTGSTASATITGTPPNQVLNLVLQPGPPGGLTARQLTTVTTPNINPGNTWTGTVSLAPAFVLLKIGLNYPGWLRVYPTAADRTNDESRPINAEPTVTVTAEIATNENQEFAPYRSGVLGANLDNPVSDIQYLSLRNLDTVDRMFEIKFRWVRLEA